MNGNSGIASIWGLVTVVGPVLLIVVLAWSMLRNRRRSQADKDRTEQATRDLYERSDRESKARDADS